MILIVFELCSAPRINLSGPFANLEGFENRDLIQLIEMLCCDL